MRGKPRGIEPEVNKKPLIRKTVLLYFDYKTSVAALQGKIWFLVCAAASFAKNPSDCRLPVKLQLLLIDKKSFLDDI